MEGNWIEGNAGGKRKLENGKDNPSWCRNPQYFLNLTVSTHFKIILRKIQAQKKFKGTKIGMNICRFDRSNPNQLNLLK